jgi:urea carboxylase-associated protein 2
MFQTVVPGGGMWSWRLPRFTGLRLTDIEGGGNVVALLYNANQPLERYNMADTLKAQHTAFLTSGRVLYSDMGRILCSVTNDTCGWHDTITGHNTAQDVEARFGVHNYQTHRNNWYRNARDNLLIELGKHGLGAQDIVANVNFFSKVAANERDELTFVPGHSGAGASVDLRSEMEVLLVLTAVPHPLDPAPIYSPKPIKVELWHADPPAEDDPCRLSRPENARGFTRTEQLFA